MKILLTAINAKYIHSNLAIRSLRVFADKYKEHIHLKEFTINHYTDDILHELYKEKPDFIGFSAYIWNIAMITELAIEIRKVLPDTKIWIGGPEVSYNSKEYLKANPCVDGIIAGEGEETFYELLEYYFKDREDLSKVKGIIYRGSNTEDIIATPFREELNLSDIPFCYEELDTLENKIIYYETSRGCPYSCSYCLSSVDKGVRLRNLELVKKELDFFLDHKVPQVKFVDRTFNCNKAHTLGIWKHIKDHDNQVTNFHFEISADILRDEEIQLLNSMRPGLVQLEIGVQSTNDATIDAISRKMSFETLKGIVYRIQEGNNVHQHLDLIAGLPYESYDIFRQSFNEVYSLRPNQFQLGFLKVLKGSAMYHDSERFGIVYKDVPPYEVLYTKWLTYDDVLKLKGIEEMVEVYYNSTQFSHTLRYMEHFFSNPFDLYSELADYYDKNNLSSMNHSRNKRVELLIGFMEEKRIDTPSIDMDSMKAILLHDMCLRERLKSRPVFSSDNAPFKPIFKELLGEEKLNGYLLPEKAYRANELRSFVHIEHYDMDVEETAKTGVRIGDKNFCIYDYMHRNPLNSEARTLIISNNFRHLN